MMVDTSVEQSPTMSPVAEVTNRTPRSWRQLLTPKSMSFRKLNSSDKLSGSDDESPTNKRPSSRRRMKKRANTMDNMLGSIADNDVDDEPDRRTPDRTKSDPLPVNSPRKGGNGNGSFRSSLLQRFLASTSKKKSHANMSGESTVSRLTDDEADGDSHSNPNRRRRITMDLGALPSRNKSKSPLPRTPTVTASTTPGGSGSGSNGAGGGGLGGLLRRFSGDGPLRRRGSRDSLDMEFGDSPMEHDEYEEMITQLQRQAEDFNKNGQIDDAISKWMECLALAEDYQDSLAKKTEMLCVLVELHLQASLRQGADMYCEDASPADNEAAVQRHRRAAERYLHRIKPAMVKPAWWRGSRPLMDLLVDAECWELALLVAMRLADDPQEECGPTPVEFATIHFHIASQKLDRNRQGEALQHLQATAKYMQTIEAHKRDRTMYLQVLDLLASEYDSQGQKGLALEAYQESLHNAPIEKHASLYCRMAHIHLVSQRLDDALTLLEAAASSLDSAEPSIRLELLQTKGDVFCRLGRTEESLKVYQSALEEVVNPADKAKLLYTLGRLCVRLKYFRPAISYFTREMEITESELGKQHMSVSRVLHELARLYDEGLGEHRLALMKLQKALQIELSNLFECQTAVNKCMQCNHKTHRMCPKHAEIQREISNQIRETKKAQGRIHFKLGDFERALKTSFDGAEHSVKAGVTQ